MKKRNEEVTPVLRQMLVAVEFSVCSRDAAQHACDLARAIGGQIMLLHVLETHESELQGLEAAHTLLQELSLLARLPPRSMVVPALCEPATPDVGTNNLQRVDIQRSVAQTILTVADQVDAQLIVIGLNGQGNPMAKTLGRVVRQVLLGGRVPVQVVPCGGIRPTTDHWGSDRA